MFFSILNHLGRSGCNEDIDKPVETSVTDLSVEAKPPPAIDSSWEANKVLLAAVFCQAFIEGKDFTSTDDIQI